MESSVVHIPGCKDTLTAGAASGKSLPAVSPHAQAICFQTLKNMPFLENNNAILNNSWPPDRKTLLKI